MVDAEPFTRAVLRVVAIVVASVVALYLVYLLRQPITWIVLGAFIAIALAVPVTLVQRLVKRRGIAIALVYVGVVLIPIGIGAIVVPPLVTEVNQLVRQLPGYVSDIEDFVSRNETLRNLEADYDITGQLRDQASSLIGRVGSAAGVLSDIGIGLVNSIFALVTILILSVFMLAGGRGWLEGFIRSRPPEQHDRLRRTADDIGKAISGYCAGALTQATVAGVSSWLVLSLLGVPYAAALGLIVGLLDLVPLVGATIGAVIVGLVTLFSDFPTDTIIWVIWAIIYQQVENSVIQPRIQSRTVNVQPIVVLIAVLFGSSLFGVLGALLAIPAAATLQICVREYRAYRRALREEAASAPAVADGQLALPDAP
jgi:predicted PurR-regulated permease PerM